MNLAQLDTISDDALLKIRLCDLPIDIDACAVSGWIAEFRVAVAGKGISYMPCTYLADEWLCPEGVPAIGIPYYLAHARLRALEQKMMYEVEGNTKDEFMRLMRHEFGHAVSYAYRLQRKQKWREIFGLPSQDETEYYHYKKYSTSYVRNLKDFYAQSHPDEDFAETCAVWLDPDVDWQCAYKGWKAYRKLEYVDTLMKTVVQREPMVKSSAAHFNIHKMRSRLETIYVGKRRVYAADFPDYYDRELRKLFVSKESADYSSATTVQAASTFLRQHKRYIVSSIAEWSGVRKYVVDQLLGIFMKRSKELALVVDADDKRLLATIMTCMTAMVKTYHYCAQYKEMR